MSSSWFSQAGRRESRSKSKNGERIIAKKKKKKNVIHIAVTSIHRFVIDIYWLSARKEGRGGGVAVSAIWHGCVNANCFSIYFDGVSTRTSHAAVPRGRPTRPSHAGGLNAASRRLRPVNQRRGPAVGPVGPVAPLHPPVSPSVLPSSQPIQFRNTDNRLWKVDSPTNQLMVLWHQ